MDQHTPSEEAQTMTDPLPPPTATVLVETIRAHQEFWWLIESKKIAGVPVYATGNMMDEKAKWTSDPWQAARFKTKQGASDIITWCKLYRYEDIELLTHAEPVEHGFAHDCENVATLTELARLMDVQRGKIRDLKADLATAKQKIERLQEAVVAAYGYLDDYRHGKAKAVLHETGCVSSPISNQSPQSTANPTNPKPL